MSLRSSSPNRRAVLASLSAALPAAAVAAPAAAVTLAPTADPHLVLLPALRQAYAWTRKAQPFADDPRHSIEGRAYTAVLHHCWDLSNRVIAMPTPTTPAGLGVLALALTIWGESSIGGPQNDGLDHERYPEERRLASAVRAMLSVSGVEPLPDWTGFGDEPDSQARWEAMMARAGEGVLPAWAIAGKSGPDGADLATGGQA